MAETNDLQGFFDSMLAPDTTPSVERAHSLSPEPVAEASRPFPGDGHAATASSTAGTASASGAAGTAASVPATLQPSRLQPSALRNGDTQAGAPLMAVPVQVPAPMPEEPDPHAAPPREWVVFNLGAQTYALDVSLVREIVRPPHMEPMPHAPPTLVGMANLRGIVVPVFDIARLLGWQPEARDGLARVIVIEHDDDLLGLLVDAVQEILRFDGAKVEPPPSVGAMTQHVVALLRRPDSLVQLLDPATLFALHN